MFSGINRVCSTHTYVPVLTEIEGLALIAGGAVCLGVSGILKADEYCTGRKYVIPFITDDAGRFNARIGLGSLQQGFKQIAPLTGIVLVIYVLSAKLFFR